MDKIIEIENRVDEKMMRYVHLMANHELTNADLACYLPPKDMQSRITCEVGAWHLRAEWPHFGLLEIRGEGWPVARRVVIKVLQKGDRISAAVKDAAAEYLRLFGVGPHYVRLRKLPKGVEDGTVIMYQGWEMILVRTEWMMDGCVAVEGCGVCQRAVISEQ